MKSKLPKGFCPQCRSTTFGGATKCLYCGAELPNPMRNDVPFVARLMPRRLPQYFLPKLVAAVIILLYALVYMGGLVKERLRPPTPQELATPFQKALLRDDYKEARQLLARGADPNLAPRGGDPPLYAAVSNKRRTLFLLQSGANGETANSQGATALMKALWLNDFQTATLLLENGAMANVYYPAQNTSPLQIAVQKTAPRSLIVTLLKKEANVNVTDARGVTVLMIAAQRGDLWLTKQLLSHGAQVHLRGWLLDPTTKSLEEMSALDVARKNKRRDLEKLLLAAR